MATRSSREKAAQAWCEETTKHKEMDVELAEAFAEILDRERAAAVDQAMDTMQVRQHLVYMEHVEASMGDIRTRKRLLSKTDRRDATRLVLYYVNTIVFVALVIWLVT